MKQNYWLQIMIYGRVNIFSRNRKNMIGHYLSLLHTQIDLSVEIQVKNIINLYFYVIVLIKFLYYLS